MLNEFAIVAGAHPTVILAAISPELRLPAHHAQGHRSREVEVIAPQRSRLYGDALGPICHLVAVTVAYFVIRHMPSVLLSFVVCKHFLGFSQ